LLAGCERRGPAQKAGEKVDKGVDDAGRALEKTREKAADKLEETGKKIRETTKWRRARHLLFSGRAPDYVRRVVTLVRPLLFQIAP